VKRVLIFGLWNGVGFREKIDRCEFSKQNFIEHKMEV